MKDKKYITLVTGLLFLGLFLNNVFAVTCDYYINSSTKFTYEINKPGVYCVTDNITISGTWFFTINSSDVIIDLQGHTLSSNSGFVEIPFSKVNITIRNGKFTGSGADAIEIGSGNVELILENITIEGSFVYTISAYQIGVSLNIKNSVITGGSLYGIRILVPNYINITNSRICGNGVDIYIANDGPIYLWNSYFDTLSNINYIDNYPDHNYYCNGTPRFKEYYNLTIILTTISGEPLINATVVIDGTNYTTNEYGVVYVDNLVSGTHNVSVVESFERYIYKYTFVNWSTGETSPNITITLNSDLTIIGYYNKSTITYILSIRLVNGTEGISGVNVVIDGINYTTDENGYVNVTLIKGVHNISINETYQLGSFKYTFVNWSIGEINTTIKVNLTDNTSLVAFFNKFVILYLLEIKLICNETPLENVEVKINDSIYKTLENGTILLKLIEGEYKIEVPKTIYNCTFEKWNTGEDNNIISILLTNNTTLIAYYYKEEIKSFPIELLIIAMLLLIIIIITMKNIYKISHKMNIRRNKLFKYFRRK